MWATILSVVLLLVPIGFVSGDGIAHSAWYAAGMWVWNPNHLLFELFAEYPRREQWAAITALAAEYPHSEGVAVLERRVHATLSRGQRVDIVNLYDRPALQNPWKALRSQGYSRDTVQSALERFGVEPATRRIGPFTIRSICP